jgi:hypothetical protein
VGNDLDGHAGGVDVDVVDGLAAMRRDAYRVRVGTVTMSMRLDAVVV